jgi:hypothetical protein
LWVLVSVGCVVLEMLCRLEDVADGDDEKNWTDRLGILTGLYRHPRDP